MRKLLALLFCLIPFCAQAQAINTDLIGQGFGKNGQTCYTNKFNQFTKAPSSDPGAILNTEVWGNGATGTGTAEVVIGASAASNATAATVVGQNASGTGASTVVIGHNAACAQNPGIVIGNGSTCNATGQFVAGSSSSSTTNIYFGNGVTNTTAGASYSINGTGGSGNNIVGGNVTMASGPSTGTGNASILNFSTALAKQASGSSAQTNSTVLTLGNAQSAHPALVGAVADFPSVTWTDANTANSGTADSLALYGINQPTVAATNTSVVTTNAYTLYVANAPTAGTNQTLTNAYALGVGAGPSSFGGAITATGPITSTPVSLTISTATFTPLVGVAAGTSSTERIVLIHASCPCTLAAPSGTALDGEKLTLEIWQSATGTDTLTLTNSAYDYGALGAPTLSTSANAGDILGYQYSAQNSKWNYLGNTLRH